MKKNTTDKSYEVPEEYLDNFNRYLKKTMDENYDWHTSYVIRAIKDKEIRDVVKAIKLVSLLYEFKVNDSKKQWDFNLFKYLKEKKFPVNDKSKLESKRVEFAHVLVNAIWPKVCKPKRKKA